MITSQSLIHRGESSGAPSVLSGSVEILGAARTIRDTRYLGLRREGRGDSLSP